MARHNENNESKSNEVDSTTDRIQRRRIMKHMVEKRRRNRINDTLEQMRILVLKAQNKNPDNYTKMEKADIMEMTTNFLYMLNQQKSITGHIALPVSQPLRQTAPIYPSAEQSRSMLRHDYSKGYNACQLEVNSYLQKYGIQRPIAHSLTSPIMQSPVATSTPLFKASATVSRRHSTEEHHISSTTPTFNIREFSRHDNSGYMNQQPTSSFHNDSFNMSFSNEEYDNNSSTKTDRQNIQKAFEENNNSSVQVHANSSSSSNDSSCWRPW